MGRYVFKLPDVGEGIAEAEVVAWHVKVGDVVAEDQPLVDVMTDKATVEIPAPIAGTVLSANGAPGEKLAIGSVLVMLEVEGEGDAPPAAEPQSPPKVEPAPPVTVGAAAPPPMPVRAAPQPIFAGRDPADKPSASPAVRQRARDHGIELQFVPGTGPAGRITQDDLDTYIASRGQNALVGASGLAERHGIEEIKLIGLRRKIAERMQDAKRRIPHFSYIEEVDVTALEELRQHLNATHTGRRPKLTLLPFLVQALVKAMPDYPQINVRFDDDAGLMRRHEALHVGIATQGPNGLLVPVVRHAETRDIWNSAAEIARLAVAVREGKASANELAGSTITITSLGALGGIATTPVINYPEVAIVGVNKIVERPVVHRGQIAVRLMMNLSSSFDHRVVDGMDAARFIQTLKGMLEQPATLFMVDP